MRRTLPLVMLAGAAICAVIGLTHEAGASLTPGRAAPAPITPVLSARRAPALLAGLIADQQLARKLDPLVSESSAGQACLQVQVGGVPVYAHEAGTPLLAASNIKLLTAYVAASRLGPDAKLTTAAVAAKAPVGGLVDGPLFLVGGGDPLLATADYRQTQTEWTLAAEPVTKLEDLADRIRGAGVTRITGGVLGDDSRFDGQRTVPTWKSTYVSSGEVGPVGALEINGGFTVSGRRKVPNLTPAASAAQALATLLQARGVTVEGGVSTGTAPAAAVAVASVDSLPLRDVIGIMLRESDNLAAEMLVKELGHRFAGAGTWAAGLGVVRDTLASAAIPVDGLAIVDGSGLDRSDRATCATLAALDVAGGPAGGTVIAGLPRAGNCGTLVKRFVGQAAAGRVRAKTGSLTGVAALTGYVDPTPANPPPPCPPLASAAQPSGTPSSVTPSSVSPSPGAPSSPAQAPPGPPAQVRAVASGPVSFALVANGLPSDAAGRSIEDRVADILTTYPEQPPLESLGP
ncbi:MAG: D-alanyl-D-alanine carboxypeptidase/D-alanyl-D-alanine-endopeptidase [Acidimicrobiales bacterium]